MFKKGIVSILFIMIITTTNIYASEAKFQVKSDKANEGIVKVDYNSSKKGKVMIVKDGKTYTYDIDGMNIYPLQLGNGNYKVTVLEQADGNKYKVVKSENINVKLKDDKVNFLQSVQIMNWNNDMLAIKKAKELTKNAKTDIEKVKIIYGYVTQTIKYDNNRAVSVQNDYIPYLDNIIHKSEGICYDYSALFGSMLRSVGVPTKLLMGYKDDIDVYHAWNQVYISETNEWVTIDTTYDAPRVQNNIPVNMIKSKSLYRIEKEY